MNNFAFWVILTFGMLVYFWAKGPEPPPKEVPIEPVAVPTKLMILREHYEAHHIDVETFERRVGILVDKGIANAPADIVDRAWWIPMEGENDDN